MPEQPVLILVARSLDTREAEAARDRLVAAVAERVGCPDPVVLDIEPGRASAPSLQLVAGCLRSLRALGCAVELGPGAAVFLGGSGLDGKGAR